MPQLVRASEGHAFQIGQTNLYVGPGVKGTKAPAVLAFVRPGDKRPTVVADFRSSSMAVKFIDALSAGIDEGTAHKPVAIDDIGIDTTPLIAGAPEDPLPSNVSQIIKDSGVKVEVVDERKAKS